jgi:hypothetical protein
MFDIKLGPPTFQERAVLLDGLEVYNLCFDISIQVVVLDAVDLDEFTVVPQIVVVLIDELSPPMQ